MTKSNILTTIVLAVAVIGVLAGCASPADYSNPVGPCSVNNKDRSSDSKGNSVFLVYTDSCGVFTVDDAMLENKWNSTDTYAAIKVGKTYDFVTYGFRNGFLSSYPNILKATEIKK
jgi:hypothetical protein